MKTKRLEWENYLNEGLKGFKNAFLKFKKQLKLITLLKEYFMVHVAQNTKKAVVYSLCLAGLFISKDYVLGQDLNTATNPKIHEEKNNYLGTSAFILSSLIPNDDTYFYSIDYGYKFNKKNDLILGLNIYKYTSPMSTSWSDNTTYPGYVVSYGIVLAYQRYVWKNFYANQMINPLVMNYYNKNKDKEATGIMLLLATRVGYHFDFMLLNNPFYLEAGAEISYWPYNGNVPEAFRSLDNQYSSYVFSPALQFGFYF